LDSAVIPATSAGVAKALQVVATSIALRDLGLV
jgi:hypothetical protein